MSAYNFSSDLEHLTDQELRAKFHEVFNAIARKQDEYASLHATLQRIQIELFIRSNR